MFTGLVESMARVVEVREAPPGRRLVIADDVVTTDAELGDSIALNGCCLTVVERDGNRLAFDAGPETLERTNLGALVAGSAVNVERSLRFGERLGGHLVTGHIDGAGTLERRSDEGEWSTFWFGAPRALLRQMASKGSIAVDGVSLTLVDVDDQRFSVMLIPHTLGVTTLGQLRPGDRVNLETDELAKYEARQLEGRQDGSPPVAKN
ncbi:MAG: riboflavin synthase [Pirellulales bacterium]